MELPHPAAELLLSAGGPSPHLRILSISGSFRSFEAFSHCFFDFCFQEDPSAKPIKNALEVPWMAENIQLGFCEVAKVGLFFFYLKQRKSNF